LFLDSAPTDWHFKVWDSKTTVDILILRSVGFKNQCFAIHPFEIRCLIFQYYTASANKQPLQNSLLSVFATCSQLFSYSLPPSNVARRSGPMPLLLAIFLVVFALGAGLGSWLGYKFAKAGKKKEKPARTSTSRPLPPSIGLHDCYTLDPVSTPSARLKTHLYRTCEHIRWKSDESVKQHPFCLDCLRQCSAEQ